MAKDKVFYDLDSKHIPGNPGTYLLHAGQIHGICNKAEFAVYDTRDKNSPIGTLVVQEVSVNTSKLRHKFGERFKIPQSACGLETYKGDQGHRVLRIAVSDVGTKLKTFRAHNLSGIKLVKKGDKADLLLIEEDSRVKFKILRKTLVDLGLKYTEYRPRSPDIQDVLNLLHHAADFYFHLDRSFEGKGDFRLANQIKIAFVPVIIGGREFYVPEKVDGKDRDINHERLVKVWASDKDLYGIKISNEGNQPVYFSLFFFSQSNLRIGLSYSFHWMMLNQFTDTSHNQVWSINLQL